MFKKIILSNILIIILITISFNICFALDLSAFDDNNLNSENQTTSENVLSTMDSQQDLNITGSIADTTSEKNTTFENTVDSNINKVSQNSTSTNDIANQTNKETTSESATTVTSITADSKNPILSNILSIMLIVIGILIILLGIAILIRLH